MEGSVLEGNWDLQNLTAVTSWSRIVLLKIDAEISLLLCVTILQQCSQIEIFTLHVESTDDESRTVSDILLPQTQCLSIYTGRITSKLLVNAVTPPKLTGLSFLSINSRISSNVDTTAFSQMIERCQGLKHLTTFRVGPTVEPVYTLTLLEKLPHLEIMEISNGILDEDAINRISLGKAESKLRRMIFTSRRHDANEILRMVEARQQNASLNSDWSLAQISSFTDITFNCTSVSAHVKEELISRKHALENSYGKVNINLTF